MINNEKNLIRILLCDLDCILWEILLGDDETFRMTTYVRGVGDQLSKEDFLVWVEGVDDQGHQLGDLRLEGEGLVSLHWHVLWHLETQWVIDD